MNLPSTIQNLFTRGDQQPPQGAFVLYEDCSTLPLFNFIQCLIRREYHRLIISGDNVPESALLDRWNGIYLEYIELNQSNDTAYVLQLQKDILIDQTAVGVERDIEMYLLGSCTREQKEKLCDIIKHYRGFDLLPVYETVELFEKARKKIINQLAPIKLRLQSNMVAYEKYLKAQENNTVDESYFDKMLIALWKYYRQPMRSKDISVREFIHLQQMYYDEMRARQEAAERSKNGGFDDL